MGKIERKFVASIEANEYHQYLFRTIAELTHTASKVLMAEGVEIKGPLDILLKSCTGYVNGYFSATVSAWGNISQLSQL